MGGEEEGRKEEGTVTVGWGGGDGEFEIVTYGRRGGRGKGGGER